MMADLTKAQDQWIGSDAPQTDPSGDLFGYAPFAQRIATTLCTTPNPEGLVLGIDGGWGYGKTSVLNFIKFNVRKSESAPQPVIVEFNPWWFQSHDDLAKQLINQLSAILPQKSKALKRVGEELAKYSDAIDTVVTTVSGQSWLGKLTGSGLKRLKRESMDVPKLKSEVVSALRKSEQRIIVFVDDVDRLTSEEIASLFRAIKAVADFPNVIYVIAFDRAIVSNALSRALNVNGEEYLEKIVQAQFSLPYVDRQKLRSKLFIGLDQILESRPLKNFDQTRWANIYFESLDKFIKSPRDIVRMTNALSVTYPAVAGEVNPIDFVAMEFLRVFEPSAYSFIRDNRGMFTVGSFSARDDLTEVRAYHENWLSQLPEARRAQTKALLVHLFPNLGILWSGVSYGSDFRPEWRKELRICSPEVCDVYFAFGVSPDVLSRQELDELVEIGRDPEKAIALFRNSAKVRRPNGSSKARDYLDRIRDIEGQLDARTAKGLLTALSSTGESLLTLDDEGIGRFDSVPNSWRLRWAITFLLRELPEAERVPVLQEMLGVGNISLVVDVVNLLDSYNEKPDGSLPLGIPVDPATVASLKAAIVERVSSMSNEELLANPKMDYVLSCWLRWGNAETVKRQLTPLFASDEALPKILVRYTQYLTKQGMDDLTARRVPYINPRRLEPFVDVDTLVPRTTKMLERSDLTGEERVGGQAFLKGIERIRSGKNPDGFFED